MTILYIPVGPPGCGKSYLAAEAMDHGLIDSVISPDHYRLVLTGDTNDQSANATVFQIVDLIVNARLDHGLDTWVDATNLGGAIDKWSGVAEAVTLTHNFEVEVRLIVFTDLLDVVLARNAGRERVVPEDVVRRMHARLSEEIGRRHREGWPAHVRPTTADYFRIDRLSLLDGYYTPRTP